MSAAQVDLPHVWEYSETAKIIRGNTRNKQMLLIRQEGEEGIHRTQAHMYCIGTKRCREHYINTYEAQIIVVDR